MAGDTSRVGLSADDLTALATSLAQGARTAVYLRDPVPGLGLAAGTSARVVSISGTTVLVRPRGVNDELPFEADELQMTKRVAPRAKAERVSRQNRTAPVPAPPNAATAPQPVTTAPRAAKAARTPAARRRSPTTVTVTLHADLDGAWTVAVQQGERTPGKPVPVNADAVERAVAELGEPGAERAVQTAVEAARESAAARVEELTKRLADARDALAALGSAEIGNGKGRLGRSS